MKYPLLEGPKARIRHLPLLPQARLKPSTGLATDLATVNTCKRVASQVIEARKHLELKFASSTKKQAVLGSPALFRPCRISITNLITGPVAAFDTLEPEQQDDYENVDNSSTARRILC